MSKIYLDANQLLHNAFELARNIYDSGFRPTALVALWRGGTPIGIAVQEGLSYLGVNTEHFALRTRSYTTNNERQRTVQIDNLDVLAEHLDHNDRLLIVDDVFDSGQTIYNLLQKIHNDSQLATPQEIKVAMPYYKPLQNETSIKPDYYLHETDEWIVFPHELHGLSSSDILQNKPYAKALVEKAS